MKKDNSESLLPNTPNNDPKSDPILIFRSVSPEEFIEQRNGLHSDKQCFLTLYKPDEYLNKNTQLYLSEDKQCGFGIDPDGQLISVFSLEPARGSIIVKESVARGAKYLSCLGEKPRELYGTVGFKVVKQLPWDDKYAPPGWNRERFGEPDCYDMVKGES